MISKESDTSTMLLSRFVVDGNGVSGPSHTYTTWASGESLPFARSRSGRAIARCLTADARAGRPVQAGQQESSQTVPKCRAEAPLERFYAELAVVVSA